MREEDLIKVCELRLLGLPYRPRFRADRVSHLNLCAQIAPTGPVADTRRRFRLIIDRPMRESIKLADPCRQEKVASSCVLVLLVQTAARCALFTNI